MNMQKILKCNRLLGVIIMMDIILDVQTLPEPIFSRIHTPKVKVHEENGIIILTPIPVKMERVNIDKFIGMFSDGKLSSEKFIQNKQRINNYRRSSRI
jgi:hypothetical protein